MNSSGSLFGRIGLWGLILTGLIILGWVIVRYGAFIGIDTPVEQLLTLLIICLALVFIRFLPAISKSIREKLHRRESMQKSRSPEGVDRLAQTPPRNITVSEIRETMRNHYGRFWSRKIRILLVTGTPADVELLTPGLTAQYWQEDRGTLLLWGGDPAQPLDTVWLRALRQLRRTPADGLVWVTASLGSADEDAMDLLGRAFREFYSQLARRLPLYVWSLDTEGGAQPGRVTQPVGCLLPAGCRPEALTTHLQALVPDLIRPGVQQICSNTEHHFLLTLADRLSARPESVSKPLAPWLNPHRPLPLAGVVFSPPSFGAERSVKHHWAKDNRWDALPERIRELPSGLRPVSPGGSRMPLLAVSAAVLMALCGTAMAVSFMANRTLVSGTQQQVQAALDTHRALTARLQALMALQKTLAQLEYREAHGAPWYLHAGLNQNNALLDAAFPRYAQSALPLIRDAAAEHLRSQLQAFVQLPPDSPQRARLAKNSYNQLKLWLMLNRPDKMDPAWFRDTLMQDWPTRQGVKPGEWQGDGPALLAFYAAALPSHPHWKLNNDDDLVSATRGLLVRLMGMRNSESGLYQKVLAQVSHLYADMRLEDMAGETDIARLYTTKEVVPGMFTRQAWENAVQPAIDKVVKARRDEMDWVLSDSQKPVSQQVSPEVLKKQLTDRYFADFSGAWLSFLNSIRLQPTPTLSDVIDQLTLMADVRQSPLIALMNTLNVQGHTGETGEAITDSLVKSAKHLLSRDNAPAIDQSATTHGPLDDTFGPVLALTGKQPDGNSDSPLSLQTFLTRVTQVRLHLQQVTDATDPQAMTQALAQTVFQGKGVDLTDTKNYGNLVAAGLGQEWRSFGQTVFVRPLAGAWQKVLTPATESLNAQWQTDVVSDWNRSFGGRYPFQDTDSEASLTLLAKYLNTNGRLTEFLKTSLNGVLRREGSRWVPDSLNGQGLTFNPEFLNAINTLSHVSDVAFTTDAARLQFDLRPGTAAGVMETTFRTDGQTLSYANQMPVWQHFTWPGDTTSPGASLSWMSVAAGTRSYAELPGEWGLIRLLDKAQVQGYPGLNSSYRLRWNAPDGRALNYTLRTQDAEGPLVLLKLRHFTLPETIFQVKGAAADNTVADEPTEDMD
ncbi:ImcF-related family protein [Enterobacter asburiae]|uniref:ImcF-related family protein n=1 Tax=Enterobacter asburiae TaxID=61645 RepID=UPI001CBAEB98|nr:ImcF-related family protein [Enterobacter asburiae]UAN16697.1 type VI secretion protein VasK [Enterobacter asburiae]